MKELIITIPTVGQAPILEKILTAIIQDHLEKSNGCTSPGCWANAYHCAIMGISAVRPEAQYAIIN